MSWRRFYALWTAVFIVMVCLCGFFGAVFVCSKQLLPAILWVGQFPLQWYSFESSLAGFRRHA